VDAVPEEWVVEHDGMRCLEQRGDGACVALNPVTRLCTIYESRPKVCRDFARGGELCRRILAQPSHRTKATLKGWRAASADNETPLTTLVQP
jgi:Fe-S-cluster containining protein